ncbi:unnamed protein product, partial [Phaeothamnion confervicola]
VLVARGRGCWVDGRRVSLRRLGGQRRLRDCLVGAEIGAFVPDHRLRRLLLLVHHCLGVRNVFASVGNTADMLSSVTGCWAHLGGGKIWDFAAGALAVEEAGGAACDGMGRTLRWDRLQMDVVLAADTALAAELVAALDLRS